MKIAQWKWDKIHGWTPALPPAPDPSGALLLAFGAVSALKDPGPLAEVARAFPAASMLGCSTAGEIRGTEVTNETLVVTVVEFEHTQFRRAAVDLHEVPDSLLAGERLAQQLPLFVKADAEEPLVHVLVFSDGLHVNGSDLVRGLAARLPPGIAVTGGLAGDGERFQETLVLWEGAPRNHTVVALGLYGRRLKVGFGSLGGWDPFGPERLITRSKGNVLYVFDGQSALGVYKRYLGEHAKDLPASGLLFPLSLRTREGETPVVRTILSIDEQAQSLTFAGDVPEGAYGRLMKANFDRLIDGATGAARTSHQAIGGAASDLAILISCVGRKLVLQQRIEEEVEAVREVLGGRAVLAGFYSYGEISPFTPGAKCELHNQTMTITTLLEQ
jgi:hypothetical protein